MMMPASRHEDEAEEPKQPKTAGSLQRQQFCRASNGHRHKPVPSTYDGWDRHPHTSSASPRATSFLHRSAEFAVAFFTAMSLILTINFSCLGTANLTSPLSTHPEFISEAKRTPKFTLAGGGTASRRGDENSIATAATRNIQFLYPRPPGRKNARYNQTWFKEAYSGMWWQVSKQFVETDWESGFHKMPITASFKALQNGRARQTNDWLDLCVEHLSIFWKHFERAPDHSKDSSIVFPAIQEKLQEYSRRTLASCQHQGPTAEAICSSPACSTLALLPFSGKLDQWDTGLRIEALVATLVSLWDIGVRRSVVVGHTDAEAQMVESAFDKLRSATSSVPQCHVMELKFVKIHNVTDEEAKVMPKLALRGLKAAMLKVNQKDPSTSSVQIQKKEISEWFGEGSVKDISSHFQYIYFTEPDLILHTRVNALDAIRREMDRGGVFTAHRFMPLPHQRSFKNYTDFRNVIPDSGRFADIRELDRDLHSCCDAGKYYPSNPTHPSEPLLDFPCWPLQWWKCGYFKRSQQYTDIASVAELHYRIPSPLLSLDRGTGWPLIHNNQRVCFPQARNACDSEV